MKELKKFSALILSLSLVIGIFASVPSYAATTDFSINSSGVLVRYNGTSTDVVIPDGVKAIGTDAFIGKNLTSVVIPEGVASIGADAFQFCKFQNLRIPNSVTSIGNYAFSECYNLTSVTLGTGTASIGENAFRNCTSLASINLPNSIARIGNSAFYGCRKLTGVTLPDKISAINDSVFAYTGLESISIPDTVTSIGPCAFYTSNLKSIIIPNSVTSIGDYAFSECAQLADVSVPNGFTNFGGGVFRHTAWYNSFPSDYISMNGILLDYKDTVGTTSINIPGNITKISKDTFYGQSSKTSVMLPDSVTSIGEQAFESCSGLTAVSIPSSVTVIGKRAFANCTGLVSVTMANSVTSMGDEAFTYCRKLTNVTLSNRLTRIGISAFEICESLKSITIPGSVKSIGSYAFYHCDSLTSIVIPNGVSTIENGVFSNCGEMTEISIGATVTKIGENVFLGVHKSFNPTVPDDRFIIRGYDKTYVQDYAITNQMKFVSLGTAPLVPAVNFTLDTNGTYSFANNSTYYYMVKTKNLNIPTAASSNIASVTVSYAGRVSGGYLFRLNRVAQGTAVITTKINNEVASFTAKAGPSAISDTTRPFYIKRGGTYTFKITVVSISQAAPQFTVGTASVLKVQYAGKSGSSYYFRVQAAGVSGSGTGVFTKMPGESAVRQCIVNIA